MNRNFSPHFVSLLFATFLLAFAAAMLPLPDALRWLRPNVILLVLVFWLVQTPHNTGIGFAWFVGLVFDGMSGGTLGQHALSFSLVAYIVLVSHQRIRVFDIAQQSLLVFFLLALDQLIADWINMVMRGGGHHLYLLANALVGALCWPLLDMWLSRSLRFLART